MLKFDCETDVNGVGLPVRSRARRCECADSTCLAFERCAICSAGLCDCAAQKLSTASTTAALISCCRSGEAITNSSSRFAIEPASSSTAGSCVFFSTNSVS